MDTVRRILDSVDYLARGDVPSPLPHQTIVGGVLYRFKMNPLFITDLSTVEIMSYPIGSRVLELVKTRIS